MKTALRNRIASGLAGLVLATGLGLPATAEPHGPSRTAPLTVRASRSAAPPGHYVLVGSFKIKGGQSNADNLIDDLNTANFKAYADLADLPDDKENRFSVVKRVLVSDNGPSAERLQGYLRVRYPELEHGLAKVEKKADEELTFIHDVKQAMPAYEKTLKEQIAARKVDGKDLPFYDIIKKYADKEKRNSTRDMAFYYSIIKSESHFNPTATSTAGAKGLGQIMPKTAYNILYTKEVTVQGRNGRKERVRVDTDKKNKHRLLWQLYSPASPLYKIETNLQCTVHNAVEALNHCNNDIGCAARYYNAGPRNMNKGIRETVNYQRKIERELPNYQGRIASRK